MTFWVFPLKSRIGVQGDPPSGPEEKHMLDWSVWVRGLVDEMYDLRQLQKTTEDRLVEIREIILETGRARIEGDRVVATIEHRERETLDMDVIRSMLTAAQIAKASRSKPFKLVRTKLKTAKGAKKAAGKPPSRLVAVSGRLVRLAS